MRQSLVRVCMAASMLMLTAQPNAFAWVRNPAKTLAVLPEGATGPEGLTVGPDGNIYVTTLGFSATGPVGSVGQLYVIAPDGTLIRRVNIRHSTPTQLGLGFRPITHELLTIDAGAGVVRRVNPENGASSVFMTVTGNSLLNGLAFDNAGNTYVTDSAQGIIWVVGPKGGAASVWLSDKLLTTTGVPGFGANGIVFNHDFTKAYITNTGNRQIISVPINNGQAGTPAVFVNSVNGPDGLAMDAAGNLWVCANQNDEIVVLDPSGKAIGRVGDFYGVVNGVPRGLLYPASPAFSADGKTLFVSNVALDLRILGDAQSPISQYAAQVRRYTVSKISTTLAPIPGGSAH